MKKPLIFLFTFLFCSSLFSQVVINEFSAANIDQFFDNTGEDSDWVELYNNGASSVDLSGWYLSDRETNPTKWTFPNGTTIGANAHLLIWCSGSDNSSGSNLHTNFKVKQTKSKEDIVLSNPSGTIVDIHLIERSNQLGHSWARTEDGGDTWGVSVNPSPNDENTNINKGYSNVPDIKPSAGYYSGSVEVSIESNDPDATIYYTTDGSTPDEGSNLYTDPFNVNSTVVIRAIGISSDNEVLNSFIETNTYILDKTHSVKIFSIAGDDIEDLMDGDQFDPQASLEYFGPDGIKIEEGFAEYNKHGNDSWAYDQRGIDLICRDEFGYDADISDQLFSVKDRDEYQRLILKAGANDNYPFEDGAQIRDAYVHTLSHFAGMEMDERTYEPAVLYINGEYWGVYDIREKVDDLDFTEYYYDQTDGTTDMIKTWGGTWEEFGSWDDWYDLKDFINDNDMTDDANYEYVGENLEFLSVVDYVILHAHIVSKDWLNWNTAWWRGTNPDGGSTKWKYLLWDEDATFGHYVNYTNIPDESAYADPCNPEEILPWVDFEGHIQIFKDLYENDKFKALYINRYADLVNTYLGCDYMIPLLDSLIADIEPEMEDQIDRWGGSYDGWQDNVQELKDFIEIRCEVIEQAIVDCYEDDGITGPYELVINVEPPGAGDVKANTIVGLAYPWNATYFGGIEIELTAIPKPGNTFTVWEVNNNIYGPDQFSEAIKMSLVSDDEITAYFNNASPCSIPSSIEIEETMTTAMVTWNGAPSAVGFNIEYRKLGSSAWEELSSIENEIFLNNLEPCTEYELRIRAVCQTELSSFEELVFKTKCNVGLTELDGTDILFMDVTPNPFDENLSLTFELVNGNPLKIEMINMQGQIVSSEWIEFPSIGKNTYVFDQLDNLTSGMYMVRLISGNSMKVRQVIKQDR